ncbi:tetratricopeptide repeat protein [Streptomyces sp. NPDC048208]
MSTNFEEDADDLRQTGAAGSAAPPRVPSARTAAVDATGSAGPSAAETEMGQVARDTGAATAIGSGIAVSGIYNARTELPADALRPASLVDAREGLDDLPYRPDLFVGRGGELDGLDTALAQPGVALVQAVHGLGGIGKSTLAAHWAASRDHGHRPVRWFTADSPAGVQQGLADLAVALQPALKVLPVEALAEYGLQWLATHTGWLVVLDNVNDPAHIAPLLVRAPGGRFLITSRIGDGWGNNVALVRLDVLDPGESLALLTSIVTGKGPRPLDGAAELCEELGHLPLAVEQAAAYIAQTPFTTPRSYLDLLAENPAEMFGQGGILTDAERTVARVWNITLDHITTRQPAAVDLLRTLAWYAPEVIPVSLAALPGGRRVQTNQALGLLTAYSMITPDPATDTIAVHRLVQTLARTPDPTNPHRTPDLVNQARDNAVVQLRQHIPQNSQDPGTWDTWRQLLPHIDAFTHRTDERIDSPDTAYIHNEIGGFLRSQGLANRAISYLQRAQNYYERAVGSDHPNTLTSRNNLAHAYQDAGDHTRVVPLLEQNLDDRVRILGPEHPDTLTSRNNLAAAYQAAGDHARAVPLHQQNLDDRTRILGPEHPHTLVSRNNLADAYQAAGNHGRAVPLHQQNLDDRTRVLGPEHPDTLTSRNNLATAYQDAGDHARAIPLLTQSLDDSARILGPDHPTTFTCRNNLAHAYQAAGDHARATTLHQRALEDRIRILGPEHPDSLTSRNNLAGAYQAGGDHARAIPLLEQTLGDFTRILGPEHPTTLTSRNNLAGAYQAAGDHARAIPLHRQNLDDLTRILGPEHPTTLTSRNNLAGAYQAAGDHARAISLHQQNVDDFARILDTDHPSTLTSRNNLALAHRVTGNLDQAITLFRQNLTLCKERFGADHPLAVQTQHAYDSAWQKRAVTLPKLTFGQQARR